jgi:flavorubredoxin
MKTTTTEVASDVYRISTFIPEANMQFNQFLVRDDEPLLYHTGMNALFPLVHAAVAELIAPASLRWISFSHFEADECGALPPWFAVAPRAQAACSAVAAMVSVSDQCTRPVRALADGEVFVTGKRRFRFVATPHFPHGWDAGHLFEETERTLFCSDVLHQMGDVEALTEGDVVGRYSETMKGFEASPLLGYLPYGKHTTRAAQKLAALEPRTLLPMHGSAFRGDGARALADAESMLAGILA